jgi:hypothetical protein
MDKFATTAISMPMTSVRMALAWSLYYAGDLAWRVGAGGWPGKHFEFPYRLYNCLMCWSSDCQGESPIGPWRSPEA